VSDVITPDALAVECPTCKAKVRAACYYQPQAGGPYWPRDPHPERVAAARLARDQQKRSESAWLELAEIWRDASEDDQRAILAVVKLRQALPVGIDGLVRVFEHGARKHNGGNLGIAPGVTADDCVEHLIEHGHQLLAYGPESRDAETGRLDAAHAAARGVMVAQLVKGRR
jgi:hypothetical protein